MSSWPRMSKVLERYERLACEQLREMKVLQKTIIENRNRDNPSARKQLVQIEEQLLSGLQKMLGLRVELEEHERELFDNRVEPIRIVLLRQIQTAVSMNKNLPAPPPQKSTNPFDESEEDANPYELESQRYIQSTKEQELEKKLKLEDAKAKAEATARLAEEMRDLEEIFTELATIVHQQHDMVDSIEEHVERATEEVQRGSEQIKKAVNHKAAKAPVVAAVVGGLAVGGPVGVAAGSAIAGIAAGVGGLVAGIYGGKWFKNAVKRDLEQQ